MEHKKLIILAGVVVALLLGGCASPPERPLSEKLPSYATLPNGYNPLNPNQLSPVYAAATRGTGENLTRELERKRGHALNLLSLSGGGQNGAFGAGFLTAFDITVDGAAPQAGADSAAHALRIRYKYFSIGTSENRNDLSLYNTPGEGSLFVATASPFTTPRHSS